MPTTRLYEWPTRADEVDLNKLTKDELIDQVLARDDVIRVTQKLLWVTVTLLWLLILLPGRPA